MALAAAMAEILEHLSDGHATTQGQMRGALNLSKAMICRATNALRLRGLIVSAGRRNEGPAHVMLWRSADAVASEDEDADDAPVESVPILLAALRTRSALERAWAGAAS
jgi:hypothetical protein